MIKIQLYDPSGRQSAIQFLSFLNPLPGEDIESYQKEITAGKEIRDVLSELRLGLTLLFERQGKTIEHLNRDIAIRKVKWDRVQEELRALRDEPVREQLAEAMAAEKALQASLSQAREELAAVKRALAAEKEERQRENSEWQKRCAAQNEVIARQQLRLNMLLGGPSKEHDFEG